jgi:hypothetical protein
MLDREFCVTLYPDTSTQQQIFQYIQPTQSQYYVDYGFFDADVIMYDRFDQVDANDRISATRTHFIVQRHPLEAKYMTQYLKDKDQLVRQIVFTLLYFAWLELKALMPPNKIYPVDLDTVLLRPVTPSNIQIQNTTYYNYGIQVYFTDYNNIQSDSFMSIFRRAHPVEVAIHNSLFDFLRNYEINDKNMLEINKRYLNSPLDKINL